MNDLSASSQIIYRAVAGPARRGAPYPGPVGQGAGVALHHADDRAAAGDQYLPAGLDDLSVLHQLPRQPGQRADEMAGDRLVPVDPDRSGHLGGDAGDGAFRDLDRGHRDRARFRTCLPDRQEIPRPRHVDHDHPAADDAVTGRGRQFLDVPLPAADRTVQLRGRLLHGPRRLVVPDAGRRDAQSLGHRHRRCLDVDALCDADLPGRPALDPGLHL